MSDQPIVPRMRAIVMLDQLLTLRWRAYMQISDVQRIIAAVNHYQDRRTEADLQEAQNQDAGESSDPDYDWVESTPPGALADLIQQAYNTLRILEIEKNRRQALDQQALNAARRNSSDAVDLLRRAIAQYGPANIEEVQRMIAIGAPRYDLPRTARRRARSMVDAPPAAPEDLPPQLQQRARAQPPTQQQPVPPPPPPPQDNPLAFEAAGSFVSAPVRRKRTIKQIPDSE